MGVAKLNVRVALLVVGLAAVGGVMAAIAFGDDPPATASFRTVDASDVFQRLSGAGSGTTADIVTGGTVTFTNSSAQQHNVHFTAGPNGVSCTQTTGGPSSSSVRFPVPPASGNWAGSCTFTQPGTYSFVCDIHVDEGMTGTVVVTNPGAPPGTTTTTPTGTTPAPPVTTTTPTGTTTTSTTPTQTTPAGTPTPANNPSSSSAGQTPATGAKAVSVKLSLTQRGLRVRGTIKGAKGSARVKIALTARRGALGLQGKAAAPVGIGNLSALTTKAGALTFAVSLDGKARAALTKHGRLAVTVLVRAPSVAGTATSKTFKIVVRPVSS